MHNWDNIRTNPRTEASCGLLWAQ